MNETSALSTRNGLFRVRVTGSHGAPVLLFSNSLGTPLEMWENQVKAFASRYRVVCLDTRGHGGSPVTKGPYSFDMLGDDVLAVMDALQVARAVFCGISMGGHTGLWLGIHAPERFLGIAVCNSAARIGTREGWVDRATAVRKHGVAGMQQLAVTAPERWFTAGFIQAHPHVVSRMQGWIAEIDPEGYASCCDALAASDLRPQMVDVKVPTLLLAGASDPVTTVADAEAMHAGISESSLAVVPASHLSNVEAPDPFNHALSRFIASLD